MATNGKKIKYPIAKLNKTTHYQHYHNYSKHLLQGAKTSNM